MREVFVAGVSMTPFAKVEDASETSLAGEAIAQALTDAQIDVHSIGAIFVGNVFGSAGIGQRILADSELLGKPVVNVENACASATSALLEAIAWLRAEMIDAALVVGVEVLSGRFDGALPIERDRYAEQGLTLPALYALRARRHMEVYGSTARQFALVSVKNRKHGSLNPLARFREPVSVEEVLAARPIAEPLTLLQCCANADGAAAAVLVAGRRPGKRAVRIDGSALTSGRRRDEIGWNERALTDAGTKAYALAGIGPSDVAVAEVHDAFSAGELLAYERLGFAPSGAGGAELERGRFALGSAGVVVNPSGGLLSRGHPLGATGLAQVYEIVTQLRGEAGSRQAAGATVGLTATMGGTLMQLETNAAVVHVFST